MLLFNRSNNKKKLKIKTFFNFIEFLIQFSYLLIPKSAQFVTYFKLRFESLMISTTIRKLIFFFLISAFLLPQNSQLATISSF